MYDETKELLVHSAGLPFMQAAKALANAAQMNDHGPLHAQRVQSLAAQIASLFPLSPYEHDLLGAAALLHDIGMAQDRENHHTTSKRLVLELSRDGRLPFNADEAEVVGTLCQWHRKDYDPDAMHQGLNVRVGLLASMLRLADAMDLDYRRSDDYPERQPVITRLFQAQEQHHQSVRNLIALRLYTTRLDTRIELFVDQIKPAALQLVRLIDELMGTPIRWPVQLIPTHRSEHAIAPVDGPPRRAVLFAYCNAHGIVQAAITKRQLVALGYDVQIVCDKRRTGDPPRFWTETYATWKFGGIDLAVVLDLLLPEDQIALVTRVTNENRHCRWIYGSSLGLKHSRVNALRAAGVDLLIADDRALFAGSTMDEVCIFWLRVAGLCNFDDPLVSHSGVGKDEYGVARGVRCAMYRAVAGKAGPEEYAALAERIVDNDRGHFLDLAATWTGIVEKAAPDVARRGRVLILDTIDLPGRFVYDVAYHAIERQGICPYTRKADFAHPYAIHKRSYGDKVFVLFLSRFLDAENMIPVKYFVDPTPQQVGRCCTIWDNYSTGAAADAAIENTINRINAHMEC